VISQGNIRAGGAGLMVIYESETIMSGYPSPVDKLLTLGDPRQGRGWRNYLELGLGPEHIPELIRMVLDPALNQADSDSPLVWAPIHAWRTLGQLHAEDAVQPLLQVLQEEENQGGDWALEELPEVFAMIGPAAFPALAAFLADTSRGLYSRAAAGRALEVMAREHPEVRDQCIDVINRQLGLMNPEEPELNAFLIGNLIEMEAVESAPLIERAFVAGCVDETIVGRWENVAWDLGVSEEEPPPYSYNLDVPRFEPPRTGFHLERPPRDHQAKAKAKAKRKQAAKSRKRNRQRKRK
jgi:hypothetical protein